VALALPDFAKEQMPKGAFGFAPRRENVRAYRFMSGQASDPARRVSILRLGTLPSFTAGPDISASRVLRWQPDKSATHGALVSKVRSTSHLRSWNSCEPPEVRWPEIMPSAVL